MTFCKRCKKPLSNPKSIMRGYGPVCYKKINWKEQTTLNPDEVPAPHEIVKNYVGLTCFCGETLDDFRMYEHPEGIKIGDKTYWVYAHCSKCGCDIALWKLDVQLQTATP